MAGRSDDLDFLSYQNGGNWVENRKQTLELAKEMTGGLNFGMRDLVALFSGENRQQLNVNLNSIPTKIPEVFESQLRSLRPLDRLSKCY